MAEMSKRFMNSRWMLPYSISHLIVFGQTGSGKSCTLKSCVERAFLRGNTKIIDLYSGGSEEGAYYALPSEHPFWKDREFSYRQKITKAREFPLNCLIPVCRNMPKEIPDIFTPFTIPINTITEADLKSVLGKDLTKNEIAAWRTVTEKINRETTLIDVLNYVIDTKTSTARIPGVSSYGISSIYNMFSTFKKERLFSSYRHPLALDLVQELRSKNVITSLILKYFPEELWGFIINYFIHAIHNIMLQGKIKHNVIIVLREIGDFLEAEAGSSQDEAVKTSMIHILRKGRKHKLYFWADNQTPLNLDIIKTQFKIKICHFVDNTVELKDALGELGTMLLNREDYSKLMSFIPGRCYVLSDRGLFNPQMFPPLSRMSGKEDNDFFVQWRNEKGSRFKNISNELLSIDKEYKESENKWNIRLEKQKIRKREEKEREKRDKVMIKMRADELREKDKLLKKLERDTEKFLENNNSNTIKKKIIENKNTKEEIIEHEPYII